MIDLNLVRKILEEDTVEWNLRYITKQQSEADAYALERVRRQLRDHLDAIENAPTPNPELEALAIERMAKAICRAKYDTNAEFEEAWNEYSVGYNLEAAHAIAAYKRVMGEAQGTTDRVVDIEAAAKSMASNHFGFEDWEAHIDDAKSCAETWGLKWK